MKIKNFGGQLEGILEIAKEPSKVMEDGEGRDGWRFKQLPISLLKSGIYQPRKNFGETELQELSTSIVKNGILQPLLVRESGEEYEIIAGERRWRAASKAGLETVPVIVCDITDETALAFGLIENIQRQDLNPIEEAQALQRLISDFKMTHEKVATTVGKSRVSITNMLRLLILPDEIQAMITSRLLDMGHARALVTLNKEQQMLVANAVIQKCLSVRETEKLVQKLKRGEHGNQQTQSYQQRKSDRVIELEQLLSEKFSTQVNLVLGNNGQCRMVINFDSISEVERYLSVKVTI